FGLAASYVMNRVMCVGDHPSGIEPQWNAADPCLHRVDVTPPEVGLAPNHLRVGIASRIDGDHPIPVRDRLIVPPHATVRHRCRSVNTRVTWVEATAAFERACCLLPATELPQVVAEKEVQVRRVRTASQRPPQLAIRLQRFASG